jgi:hypothetical protein
VISSSKFVTNERQKIVDYFRQFDLNDDLILWVYQDLGKEWKIVRNMRSGFVRKKIYEGNAYAFRTEKVNDFLILALLKYIIIYHLLLINFYLGSPFFGGIRTVFFPPRSSLVSNS